MTTILVHEYQPVGTCLELFSCRDPEVLIVGPSGTGKSRAVLEKIHRMCLLNPGMRALVVRKTRVSLKESSIEALKEVVAETQEAGMCWPVGGEENPTNYNYSNDSTIVFGGMDRATKILSTEWDIIFVEEAIELTENDWESLTTRLRNNKVSFQQIIGATNPAQETHWLKARVDRGQTTMLISRHEDNPVYYDHSMDPPALTPQGAAYIEGVLEKLTGVRYMRFRKGEWSSAEGAIYAEEWDSDVHLIDPIEVIPTDWDRYWAIDFGYNHPFVLQCWAMDGDDHLYLYREIYMTQRTVEEHAQTIMEIVAPFDGNGERKWIEPKPRAVICDHDAEGRATFEKHTRLYTTKADKKVLDGIQEVQGRLKVRGDGKPGMMLMRGSLVELDQTRREAAKPCSTAEEVSGYVWAPMPDGKPSKEQPLKIDDDGMDCMRYMAMYHRQPRGKARTYFPGID